MSTDGVIRRKIGEVLSIETEALNEALAQAEAELQSLHLGVPGEIQVDEDVILFFRKKDKGWILGMSVKGNDVDARSTSRRMRMAVAEKLPELLAMMKERTRQEIEDVRAARMKVQQFIEDLKAGKL